MNEIVLPGLIDVHTHCRQPGGEHKETFTTATRAALAGGITTIVDMPNNAMPTISPEALREKQSQAYNEIYTDLGFHFGSIAESTQYFDEVKGTTFANKLYMNHTTGTLLVEDPDHLEEIFAKSPKNKIIMVHAEGKTLATAIELARRFRRRLHACHLSLASEVKRVKKAREDGVRITAEVTPHHLFLTHHDAEALKAYGQMRPPLTSKWDQEALWTALRSGVIDIVASDHAPHTREEKESDSPPSGVPGLETTLPLMLTALVDGRITEESLKQVLYENPKRIFKIPTNPSTFVTALLDRKHTIDSKDLYTKCGWTPFDGAVVKGEVRTVMLREALVFANGRILGSPQGKIIRPVPC